MLETKREAVQPRTGLAPQASFVGGLFAAVVVLLTWGSSPQKAAANTLEVGGGGYPTISAAVQAAAPGDTILIHAGTYHEAVDLSGKAVTVQPYGDGPVVLDEECSTAANRPVGFYIGSGSGQTIKGVTITNTVNASVYIEKGANHITIDGMTLQNFDCTWTSQDPSSWGQYRAGVTSWYGGSNITITNNTIRHRTSGEVRGSADGIWFKSNDSNPSGGGHYIAGNTIIGGWDGIGGEEEGSAHGAFDKDTTIENNTIQGTADDCIQVEGGGQNVHVRNNDLSGCGTGIAFARPVTGPLYIEGNRIHDLVTGLYDNHFCYKVGNSGSAVTYLTGNTCDVRGSPGQEADGIHQTNEGMSPIVSRNNSYYVTRYVYTLGWGGIPAGTSFDEDCMYTTNENFAKWHDVYYTSLARFQQATGQERNGRVAQDCSFLDTLTPSAAPSPPPQASPGAPQSTPTPAGQTPSVRPATDPEQPASSDDDLSALTSPIALGLEALAGLTLLGLGLIGGVRSFRRRRPAP